MFNEERMSANAVQSDLESTKELTAEEKFLTEVDLARADIENNFVGLVAQALKKKGYEKLAGEIVDKKELNGKGARMISVGLFKKKVLGSLHMAAKARIKKGIEFNAEDFVAEQVEKTANELIGKNSN